MTGRFLDANRINRSTFTRLRGDESNAGLYIPSLDTKNVPRGKQKEMRERRK